MNPNPPIKSQRSMTALLAGGAILVCASVLGCAADSELKRYDPSLNEIDLRQGKIADMGVVKFQEPDQIRPPLIATLERTFREERPDLTVLPADSVRHLLGGERYRKLMLGYEYQGTLDGPALSEISDSLRGAARFLLLARVVKDRTRSSARGMAQGDTGLSSASYAMGITGRDAQVVIHLYDLSRRSLAVTARLDGSSENSRPVLSPIRPGSSGTVELGRVVPPEETGYPASPELAQAVEDPFRTFAKTLPGTPLPAGAPQPVPARR
ncbi:MAG TPA: hypothetical protein VET83_00140 [Candidatus Dormibacteraeota bacterium]|nr:hypothetical protein [Candidatus Dormibacteraeota bacterium]